jgi:HAD superfamily hydrolase (TIGR01549 family)
VTTVVFDIGETLVGETRHWTAVAEQIGVPTLAFFGLVGALIERREHHWQLSETLGVERLVGPMLEVEDFYPDVAPCLERLRADGYRLGLAGNQPLQTADFLESAGLDVDFVATSEGWGVAKPAPEFFAKVVAEAGVPAEEIAYVGDRVDNDVLPARRARMLAVFLRRGPWGYIQASWPEAEQADISIQSLAELPEALASV